MPFRHSEANSGGFVRTPPPPRFAQGFRMTNKNELWMLLLKQMRSKKWPTFAFDHSWVEITIPAFIIILFSFQTIFSDVSGTNCSQIEEQLCSDITARLASDSRPISSCSSVCCMTSKCNEKEQDTTTTVLTESIALSTTASTKGTLRVYLQQ